MNRRERRCGPCQNLPVVSKRFDLDRVSYPYGDPDVAGRLREPRTGGHERAAVGRLVDGIAGCAGERRPCKGRRGVESVMHDINAAERTRRGVVYVASEKCYL